MTSTLAFWTAHFCVHTCVIEKDSMGFHYQFIVPSSLQRKILHELNSGVGGGHLGAKKMLVKEKNRHYWPGWSQDVEIYCNDYIVCASKRKPS